MAEWLYADKIISKYASYINNVFFTWHYLIYVLKKQVMNVLEVLYIWNILNIYIESVVYIEVLYIM